MSELGRDARSLVDAALDADEPSAADAARVRAKVDLRISVAALGAAAAISQKANASTSAGTLLGGGIASSEALGSTAWVAAKALLAVALGGATVAAGIAALGGQAGTSPALDKPALMASPGGATQPPLATQRTALPLARRSASELPTVTGRSTSERPRVTPRATAALAPVASTASSSNAPNRAISGQGKANASLDPPPSGHLRTDGDTGRAPRAVAPVADSVAEEAALLHAAQAALSRGDSSTALARLDEHAARFPRGALAAERQAARVFALCALGLPLEARRAASAFLAQNPRSPLAAQVRRSCDARRP